MKRSAEEFRRLELTMSRAWPAFEEIDYDGWIIRFADGYTKRANSVNPHFGSSLPLLAKIEYCETAYRDRDLPTIFRLTPFSQPSDLDQTLAARGYEKRDPTLVMTCSLDERAGDQIDRTLIVSADKWFATFARLRKITPFQSDAHRKIVLSSEGALCYAAILLDGDARACGLGVHIDHAMGLFDLFTHESYRGQGLGSSVARRLLGWGRHHGAVMGFLQVHSQNASARRLYQQVGFEVAYPYWYRVKT